MVSNPRLSKFHNTVVLPHDQSDQLARSNPQVSLNIHLETVEIFLDLFACLFLIVERLVSGANELMD